MKNLTLNLDEEIAILSKYRITSNELMLIRTLLLMQDDDNSELFSNYLKSLHECGVSPRELFISLQNKGVILKSYKLPQEGKEFDPYEIPFNKNFVKTLYKCSFDMGKELFETYPQFGNVNGNIVGLRSVSKRFDSLEDAYFRYGRAIRWNPATHKEIIDLLEWSKEHNIINYTLTSFIIDRRWEELASLKDGQIANVNFDAIKVV